MKEAGQGEREKKKRERERKEDREREDVVRGRELRWDGK